MKLCIRISHDEQGLYRAVCPSLPGCVSCGRTRQEAEVKLEQAIRGYIAAVSNFVPERVIREIVEV